MNPPIATNINERIWGAIIHIASALIPLSFLAFCIVSNNSLARGVTQTLNYLFGIEFGIYFVLLLVSSIVPSSYIKYHGTLARRFALFNAALFFSTNWFIQINELDIQKILTNSEAYIIIICLLVVWFFQGIYAVIKTLQEKTLLYVFQLDFNLQKTIFPTSTPTLLERLHASLVHLIMPVMLTIAFIIQAIKYPPKEGLIGVPLPVPVELIFHGWALVIGLAGLSILQAHMCFLRFPSFVAYHINVAAINVARRMILGVMLFQTIGLPLIAITALGGGPVLMLVTLYGICFLFLFWYLQMFYEAFQALLGKGFDAVQ